MAQKKKPDIDTTGSGFGGTLGDLLKARGFEAPALPEAPPPPPAAAPTLAACTVRITHSRRDRGGKTVTLVEGLTPLGDGLDAVARDLRKSLGCGGVMEGEVLVLQGDLRERARDWLVAAGAKSVRVG